MKTPALLLVCSLLPGAAIAEDASSPARWARFRGPNGAGIAEAEDPPVAFGPAKALLWKTPVPPGHSSPIVWDDQLFLTAIDGESLAVMAIGRRDGVVRWRRSVTPDAIEKVHLTASPAAPTATTDGRRVYAYFGSFGLLAYELDGDEAWRRRLPRPQTAYGTASSPILFGDRLILQRDGNDGTSELLALDAATGEVAWRTSRPTLGESYSTPIVWRHDGRDEVVTLGANRVVAYTAESGKESWWAPGSTRQPIGVPVVGGGLLYASATFAGSPADPFEIGSFEDFAARYDKNGDGRVTFAEVPEADRLLQRRELAADTPGASMPMRGAVWFADENKDGGATREEWAGMAAYLKANEDTLVAIRPGDDDAAASDRVAWRADRGLSEIPSPLYYRDRLYFVRDGGMLTSYDAATGRVVIDRRRLGVLGQYVASPVAASGRIYVTSRSGTVVVFGAGDELQVLARNELGEDVHATPAIADDTLYVRSAEHLWAFGHTPAREASALDVQLMEKGE